MLVSVLTLLATTQVISTSAIADDTRKHVKADGRLDLEAIQATIDSLGLRYTITRNKFTEMTIEQRRKYAGALTPDPRKEYPTPVIRSNLAPPAYLDWRNNGGDYVTDVRSQGGCGSCWDFGSVAMLESRLLIESGMPGQEIDLSEQYVLSCIADTNNCDGGYHAAALSFLVNNGTPTESCFPYVATDDIPCSNSCFDTPNQLEYLDEWTGVTEDYIYIDDIKGA